MDINVSLLPSGGYGYPFPTVHVRPMNFMEICTYLSDTAESDPLGKYLYDLQCLKKDEPQIDQLYVMDVDFLIFYKKLCTVSDDLSYKLEAKCPVCGKTLKKTIRFERDIHFKQVDPAIMNGARIELNEHKYDTIVPRIGDFMKVFDNYLKYKKIVDIPMIKTIALIKDFQMMPNQVEQDVVEAKHEDITLLMALRDLYYDQVEPIELVCNDCGREEGGSVTIGVSNLIVDFFRELYRNSPIDGSKILFK